jgi:hypothetical protein
MEAVAAFPSCTALISQFLRFRLSPVGNHISYQYQ